MLEKFASFGLGLLTFGIYPYVYHGTHIYQTKRNCIKYRKCTLKEFKKLFDSVNWLVIDDWQESLFPEQDEKTFIHSGQCHASIYEIDNVGLILSTYGFYIAEKMKKNKIKKLRLLKIEKELVSL